MRASLLFGSTSSIYRAKRQASKICRQANDAASQAGPDPSEKTLLVKTMPAVVSRPDKKTILAQAAPARVFALVP
jgi:hypothetical protein